MNSNWGARSSGESWGRISSVAALVVRGPSGSKFQFALGGWFDGAVVATPCTTCYLSWDHLGSTRMVTDGAGNVVARHDFLAFGDEIPSGTMGRTTAWGTADGITQKFRGRSTTRGRG